MWEIADDLADSTGSVLPGSPYLARIHPAPDGSALAQAGDGARVVDLSSGESLFNPPSPEVIEPLDCIWLQLRFSPDSQWLAGNTYEQRLLILAVGDPRQALRGFATASCNTRVAFTPDGQRLVTSDLETYSVGTWQLLSGRLRAARQFSPFDDIVVSPDGHTVVLSEDCDASTGEPSQYTCTTYRTDLADGRLTPIPELTSIFPSISPGGHWLAAGARLLHLPSGELRDLDEFAHVSKFLPDGDLVTLAPNGTVTRYCRE
jgi:WD40 repeat protein